VTGHTPGPWTASSGGKSNYVASVTALSTKAKVFNVAMLARPMRGDVHANARLIAAAPDLLALAHRYANECGECGGRGRVNAPGQTPVSAECRTKPCHACAETRAVIAKAVQP
jgi:hypothetical protein